MSTASSNCGFKRDLNMAKEADRSNGLSLNINGRNDQSAPLRRCHDLNHGLKFLIAVQKYIEYLTSLFATYNDSKLMVRTARTAGLTKSRRVRSMS